uniref:Uncharacterized protein n=1 Tax=Arundo donax TaxID=35708 RepID=A0A0A9DHV6_ARUDO
MESDLHTECAGHFFLKKQQPKYKGDTLEIMG